MIIYICDGEIVSHHISNRKLSITQSPGDYITLDGKRYTIIERFTGNLNSVDSPFTGFIGVIYLSKCSDENPIWHVKYMNAESSDILHQYALSDPQAIKDEIARVDKISNINHPRMELADGTGTTVLQYRALVDYLSKEITIHVVKL